MSASGTYAVFAFGTTNDAIHAEQALLDAGIDVLLIPTPKKLGALCGLSARVPSDDRDRAATALESAGVDIMVEIEIVDRRAG